MMQPFLTADGVRLALAERGEGRPMLFQHGLCGDAAQPAQVSPDDIGFRFLTLECRGHGASEAGPFEHFSIAAFADDVARLIVEKRIERPVIGGISMGAAIALRLAVTRPELVGALVLARSAWLTQSAPDNLASYALAGRLLGQFPPQEALDRFEASPIAEELAINAPDNLVSLRGFFTRSPVEVTAALLSRMSSDGPGIAEADIKAIRMPTLVIGNSMDAVHPLDFARRLAQMIPGARCVEITSKAVNPEDYRSDFRAALRTFLLGV
jgi:pimeloyl-ACP methyl ester carboxylesterase